MISTPQGPARVIRHCPCTPGAVSCGYWNIDMQSGCPFDCSYCILQAYLPSKEPVFHTDIANLELELEAVSCERRHLRLGTGELSDSLAWDEQTGAAAKLLEMINRFPRVVLEFKTKSDRVKALLEWPEPPPNVVISWSINPARAAGREEAGAPPPAARLKAMAAVQAKGYRIGIHFDPLLLFPGWKTHYAALVGEMARILNPGQIAWWSLGALRFPPALRGPIFGHRARGSRLFWGELVPGFDGKFRYLRPLRSELFHFVLGQIGRRISAHLPLYLCMEDEEMWRDVLPGRPPVEAEINRRLYESLF
jgi:spore photoproduct lyase